MNVFQEQNLLEFSEHFKTDLNCKKYLSGLKDKTTYKCLKCVMQPIKGKQIYQDNVTFVIIENPLQQIHYFTK